MKKIFSLIILVICILSLTSCGTFFCDFCGEEKSGKKYREIVFGEELTICNDCYKQLTSMFSN